MLYSLGIIKDAMRERMRQGISARFPSYAPPSAQHEIGKDRGIIRGRTETNTSYAQRLIAWRYPRGHRVRGNPFSFLAQLNAYFGGVLAWTQDVSGNYFQIAANGELTVEQGRAWVWDDIDPVVYWARYFVGIDLGAQASAWGDLDEPATWGGELGVAGVAIGQQGVAPEDVLAVRSLIHGRVPWHTAGTQAEWLCLQLDGTTQEPDATWKNWSRNVAGVQVATRYQGWRYWSLNSGINNTYAGDPTNYPDEVTMIDGSTYAGNTASYPATLTMLDGSEYAGNPASYPASLRLVDDGDAP